MRLIVILAAALAATAATAADNVFEANYRNARENAGTPAGAAFDRALGTAIEASEGFAPAMTACLEAHPDTRGYLHGYFHFSAQGRYQVVLRPQSDFSACVESALEGHEAPRPPTLPWYNVFVFDLDA